MPSDRLNNYKEQSLFIFIKHYMMSQGSCE